MCTEGPWRWSLFTNHVSCLSFFVLLILAFLLLHLSFSLLSTLFFLFCVWVWLCLSFLTPFWVFHKSFFTDMWEKSTFISRKSMVLWFYMKFIFHFMYVYIYIYTHTYMYIYIYIYIHIYAYVHIIPSIMTQIIEPKMYPVFNMFIWINHSLTDLCLGVSKSFLYFVCCTQLCISVHLADWTHSH